MLILDGNPGFLPSFRVLYWAGTVHQMVDVDAGVVDDVQRQTFFRLFRSVKREFMSRLHPAKAAFETRIPKPLRPRHLHVMINTAKLHRDNWLCTTTQLYSLG